MRRSHGERGVVLIIVALIALALFVIAALVIDLSQVRETRQDAKSSTDLAAAAGIRSMDDGGGEVQSWRGICAARNYLVVNSTDLTALTFEYEDGTGTPLSNPCANVAATSLCANSAPSTWGVLTGTSADGRVRATVRSGYPLPDPGFAEDADEYAGDNGEGPCDNLAVIVEKRDDATFGGAAGADGYDTRIRSVARLVQGDEGDVPAALILLEREDCNVLNVSGVNARVEVAGNDAFPGVIHADSLGTGTGCGSGYVFNVNGTTPPPRIVAFNAELEDEGVLQPGQISSRSLFIGAGGDPSRTTPGTNSVCAQETDTDCIGDPLTGGLDPVARNLETRRAVDERYREHIIDLRTTAAQRFGWTSATVPAGWTKVEDAAGGCVNTGFTFSAARIWISCPGGEFNANDKVFEPSVDEVVINGSVRYTGTGSTLHFKDVETLFIKGVTSSNSIQTGQNNLFVNDGALSDSDGDGYVCDQRWSNSPTSLTKMVLGAGRITANSATIRLCQTTLYLMDDNASSCSIPSVDGVAPFDNSCTGNMSVAGTSVLDWTGPNVNDLTSPTDEQLANFEDLALWSETQGTGGNSWDILGGGGLGLAGVFFTPNADPFKIGGGGNIDIEDAVFATRKLEAAGNGTLLMKPRAANAIPVSTLGGYSLVR